MSTQESATRRLVDWYVATADNANRLITPGLEQQENRPESCRRFESYKDALRWFDSERSNLVDITKRAGEIGDYGSASVLPNLLWTYFNVTKHWADWIICNELGLKAAREIGDKVREAYICTSQGVAYRNLRETELSIRNHSRAITLFEDMGDFVGLGFAKQNLANILSDNRRFAEALPLYEEALQIFDRVPDPRRGRAVTSNSMSVALCEMGEYESALAKANEALTLMTVLSDSHGIAFSLNNIGMSLAGLHRFDEAAETLTSALTLRRSVLDRYGQARTLVCLGQVHENNGRGEEARAAWREALAIFLELGAPERSDVLNKMPGWCGPVGHKACF